MQQTNEKLLASVREPAFQARINQYNALRKAEISRIHADFANETLEQKIDRLSAWEKENDFIKFVKALD